MEKAGVGKVVTFGRQILRPVDTFKFTIQLITYLTGKHWEEDNSRPNKVNG